MYVYVKSLPLAGLRSLHLLTRNRYINELMGLSLLPSFSDCGERGRETLLVDSYRRRRRRRRAIKNAILVVTATITYKPLPPIAVQSSRVQCSKVKIIPYLK